MTSSSVFQPGLSSHRTRVKACLSLGLILFTIALCQPFFGPNPALAEEDPESIHIHELIRQADSLAGARQLDTAIALGELALQKARARFSDPDTSVALALDVLGKCYYHAADYSRCESLWSEALAVRERALGEDHPRVAASLNSLAILWSSQDRYTEAELLWKRALAISEKTLGHDHLQVATSLNGLAILWGKQGKYAQAESLYQRALAIREKAPEPDHLAVASTLNNLANCCRDQVKYAQAEPLFRRALAIREQTLGPDHPLVARSLNNLANLYLDQGKHSEAGPLYKRALAINEKVLGPDHPEVASGLNNLASLYRAEAKYAQAEPLFKRALTIREKVLGPNHPLVAQTLNNLACLYRNQGRHGEAEILHKRAVSIREKVLGSFHPDVAQSLNNLAALYWDQAKYAEAEPLFKRALAIREKALGSEHLDVANSLNSLAALYADQAKYAEAESLSRRALAIREKALSPEHPDVCVSLGNLAVLYGSLGEREKSLRYYGRWRQSRQRFIDCVFSYASEDQKLRYTQQYPLISNSLLSFAITNESRNSWNAALELTLKTKALVIDAVSAEKQIAFCSYNDEIQKKAERHAQVCGEISTVTLAGIERLDPGIYRERLEALHSTKDSLETELSASCAEFKDELAARRFTVADVANALPEGSVLWEFVQYKPYDFSKVGSDKERTGPPRYLAFTLDRTANVTLTDLGDAARIDSLVSLARRLIYQYRSLTSYSAVESEKRLNQVAGKLYEVVFAPLEACLDGRTDIFISPDGQLNLLPFEILPCADGSYVVERFSISYLSSGRDVLRFRRIEQRKNRALVMGDPDFDLSQQRPPGYTGTLSAISTSSLVSFEPARGIGGCLLAPFPGLPLTRKEAESVTGALRENGVFNVDTHLDAEATEEVLKNMPAPPDVLHLATHAYFCEDPDLSKNAIFENPLLRCGVALAGANRLIEGKQEAKLQGEDGILTALEASGLNLVGTDLVVLSACETGVGEIKNGEGVYGLRRAFQCAGAGTVLMSLWKVDDTETCSLMTRFYQNWLSGQTKKEALRGAALAALNNRRAGNESTHPIFWGGFVLLGDPD
jgi:CHAT domain-containing protein/Tfp pilus assembly protein PilF